MIYAWIGAVLIGVSLGLLGSGGSILTVPILVYLVGHGEKQAVAEAFAIVGAISLYGGVRAAIAGKVDGRSVLFWAIPGMVGAAAGHELSRLLSGEVQILLLGVIMLASAVSMFRSKAGEAEEARRPRPALVAACGLGIGMLTALVGIGGGFLIVPALVLLTATPMKRAVGTSLCVIAINCATSLVAMTFSKEEMRTAFDWRTVVVFAGLGILGSYVGALVGGKMNQRMLKRVFAVFLVGLAVFVVWKQVGKVMGGSYTEAPMNRKSWVAALAVAAGAFLVPGILAPAAFGQVDHFEWSVIGAPGNRATTDEEAPFALRPLGAVPYEYRITTTKLDNTDYLEFVRAYAPFWQSYPESFELTGYWIWANQRPDGTYSYDIEQGAERYAARITWEQAARFCNWLHNGKVNEAWAFESGAYDASTFRHDEDGYHHNTRRLPGARYWIPSLDEWIKAAYYDPDRYGPGEEGYWMYPDASDEPLFMALPEDGGETIGDLLWQHGPRDLGAWDLRQYPDTQSPWGLVDISATVPDYTEDLRQGQTVFMGGSLAGTPGYAIDDTLGWLSFSGALQGSTLGALRIASNIPCPAAGSCLVVFLALISRRYR